MNVKAKTDVKANIEGRGSVCETRERAKVARIPGRSGIGDRRAGEGREGGIDRGAVPASIRQERSSGAARGLPADGVFSAECGAGEGVTDVEAAELERDAATGSGVVEELGCPGSMEKRTRVHLPVWRSALVLPVRATRCERSRSDG